MPRDIPFSLTILGFFILIIICCIYAYLIFKTIKPSQNPSEIIKLIINWLYTPLIKLDNWLKEIYIIKKCYYKRIINLSVDYLYIFKTLTFHIIFWILPRLILLIVFLIDVFYFQKIEYLYLCLPLGILLFLGKYIIYSIKKLKEDFYQEVNLDIMSVTTKYKFGVHPSEWEENYDEDNDDDMPPTMSLTLDIFINYYITQKIEKNEENRYILRMSENFYDKYKENFLSKEKDIEITKKVNDILTFELLLQYYNKNNNSHKGFKYIKIVIYSIYLFCWSYILYISASSENIKLFLEIIQLIKPQINDII